MPTYLDVRRRFAYEGHSGPVYTLAAGRGDSFFSAGADGIIAEWDGETGENRRALLRSTLPVYSLLLSDQLLLAGRNDGSLLAYDLPAGKLLAQHQLQHGALFDLQPLGAKYVLVASGDGKLSVLSQGSLTRVSTLAVSTHSLRSIAVAPGGELFAVGGSDQVIRIYETLHFTLLREWHAHSNSIFSLAFSPDGRYLLSAGRDAHLKVWDRVEGFALGQAVIAHLFTINDIAFSPYPLATALGEAHLLATASMDKTLKLWHWNAAGGSLTLLKVVDRARNASHTTGINKLCWLTDGTLLTTSDDRMIYQWEIDPV